MHGHQGEYLGARQDTPASGALSGGRGRQRLRCSEARKHFAWGCRQTIELGKYDILAFLPDKVARFLYEYHDFGFQRLELPPIPDDRSEFDLHPALRPDQVVHQKLFDLFELFDAMRLILIIVTTCS